MRRIWKSAGGDRRGKRHGEQTEVVLQDER
jgi:hypothetical protein